MIAISMLLSNTLKTDRHKLTFQNDRTVLNDFLTVIILSTYQSYGPYSMFMIT